MSKGPCLRLDAGQVITSTPSCAPSHLFGPQDALLAMTVQFRRGVGSRPVELSVDQMEERVRAQYPEIKHIFLEVDSLRERLPQDPANGPLPPRKEIELTALLDE